MNKIGTPIHGPKNNETGNDEQGITQEKRNKFYVSNKLGCKFVNIDDFVNATIQGLEFEEYTKKKERRKMDNSYKQQRYLQK